jgi:hypothetical protein
LGTNDGANALDAHGGSQFSVETSEEQLGETPVFSFQRRRAILFIHRRLHQGL